MGRVRSMGMNRVSIRVGAWVVLGWRYGFG